tara:strand:+ start:210 stop:512 length:303 start_codon:yes stop_codon:yes gene_type:complete
MIMKRKTTRRKSNRRSMLPSWNEVRMGLTQVSKLRLLFLLAKIYRSSVVPRSVKVNILSMARTGAKKVKTKRKMTRKKPRSAAQKRATRKLVALNKRRKR